MFKSKVDGLKKGEFETSEEFSQRSANIDAILSPIKTSNLYAFKIHDIEGVKYNADIQTYNVHDLLCRDYDDDQITCALSTDLNGGDYVGSNAYGVSRNIFKTRGKEFFCSNF